MGSMTNLRRYSFVNVLIRLLINGNLLCLSSRDFVLREVRVTCLHHKAGVGAPRVILKRVTKITSLGLQCDPSNCRSLLNPVQTGD
jgi:hypothetical protein